MFNKSNGYNLKIIYYKECCRFLRLWFFFRYEVDLGIIWGIFGVYWGLFGIIWVNWFIWVLLGLIWYVWGFYIKLL